MDSFLQFFEQMPSWQKLVWIFVCLSFSWFLEGVYPLAKLNYKKWKHASVNFIFLATSLTINVLFGILTVGVFAYIGTNQIGILHWIDLPIWAELIIAILFLDFVAQYAIHYYLHKVKWMWKFHMIHHSDTKVDATTGTRHHPGDYVLREVAALIAIVIIGAPFAFYGFIKLLPYYLPI